jgi:hypothetical protein
LYKLPISSAQIIKPFDGTLNIDIQIGGGNPIDVFMTAPDQLYALEKMEWSNVRAHGDFNATRTKTYSRTGHVTQGGYYLVLSTMSAGMESSSASDISVTVQLNP